MKPELRSGVSAAVFLAAVSTGIALGGTPAWADGGNGSSTLTGNGGLGGVDGSLASATGENGAYSGPAGNAVTGGGGGGGGVDLTTGNGAPGGARGTYGTGVVPGTAGATGGAGQVVSSATSITGAVSGGAGGAGQSNVDNVNTVGGGGGGGVGVRTTADVTITGTGAVTGGSGSGAVNGSSGGGGGVGVFSSANVTVEAGGQVLGGAGGGATNLLAGGGGAAAVVLTNGGIVQNIGTLTGGAGGRSLSGGGGDGGAGVQLLAGGTVVNAAGGVITGGAGGDGRVRLTGAVITSPGQGGAGIKGASVSIVNGGTITGGAGGTRAAGSAWTPVDGQAIQFTGGVNSLEIWSTSNIIGNVTAFSSADTFKLGGSDNAVFNVAQIGPAAQFRGFGLYEKTGSSTWTLTGTTTAVTPWTLNGGILQISSDGNLGDPSGGLTFNGGTLETTADITSARTVTLTGGGTFLTVPGTTLTFSNAISGAGGLTKGGDGAMVLTGNNTYTGGTTITAGTLQLGDGGTSGSIVGDVANDGALAFDRSNNLTFDGIISGSGSVSQIGLGTTTLTGVNTYSGGTTITAGTLIGSASSFGTGAILDNAALVIDQPVDAGFANAINGSGSFIKQGAGRLNYTGAGNLSGPTTVAAGTLSVNGSLAGSTVTVESGATLGGSGTVGATTIQSGGTIAPGNSIGTLHVSGAFVQAAGSVYQVQVDPTSTASDRIAVTGAATLADGAVINVAKTTNAPYVAETKYTVLTSTGGLTGTFHLTGDTMTLTPFLGLTDVYDANNAYLQVAQTRTFTSVGLTPNQTATGGGLDGLPPAGTLATALLNLPSEEAARGAFDQLSGEIHASAMTALMEDSHFVRDAAIDRVREAFCAAGFGTSQKRVVSVDGAQDARKPSSTDCANSHDRFTMWGQAFGSWGHTDGDGNAAKLSRSNGGFFIGADTPIFDTWRVGVLGGYSRSTFDVKGRNSSGSSDNYYVGLYGGTQWGALGFRTGAAYTWHDMSTSRSVAFPGFGDQLTAGYNAGTTQVFGDLGYRIDAGTIAFEPFANLAYVNLHTGSFTERGGPAALAGNGGDTNTTFTTLGLRASTAFFLGNIETTARGSLGWRHAFGDVTPASTLSFAGGSFFDIAGVPLAKDAAVVDVGLDLNLASNMVLGVSYGGQFAKSAIDQNARVTLNIKF